MKTLLQCRVQLTYVPHNVHVTYNEPPYSLFQLRWTQSVCFSSYPGQFCCCCIVTYQWHCCMAATSVCDIVDFVRITAISEKARPAAAPAVAAAEVARRHHHLAGKRPRGAGAHVNEQTAAAGRSHSPSPPSHTISLHPHPLCLLCKGSTSRRLP